MAAQAPGTAARQGGSPPHPGPAPRPVSRDPERVRGPELRQAQAAGCPGPCTDAPSRPAQPDGPRAEPLWDTGPVLSGWPGRLSWSLLPASRQALNGREPFVGEQLAAFEGLWESPRAASHSLSKAGIISGRTPSKDIPQGGAGAPQRPSTQPRPHQCLGLKGPLGAEPLRHRLPAPKSSCPREPPPPHPSRLSLLIVRPWAHWGMARGRDCLGHVLSTCCIQAEPDLLPGPAQNPEREARPHLPTHRAGDRPSRLLAEVTRSRVHCGPRTPGFLCTQIQAGVYPVHRCVGGAEPGAGGGQSPGGACR